MLALPASGCLRGGDLQHPQERLEHLVGWYTPWGACHATIVRSFIRGADAPSRRAFHTFGRLRGAERLWAAEFSKHAGRLKANLLNLSSMSDGRADVLVRGAAPGDECLHWCFPGLPHLWSEM